VLQDGPQDLTLSQNGHFWTVLHQCWLWHGNQTAVTLIACEDDMDRNLLLINSLPVLLVDPEGSFHEQIREEQDKSIKIEELRFNYHQPFIHWLYHQEIERAMSITKKNSVDVSLVAALLWIMADWLLMSCQTLWWATGFGRALPRPYTILSTGMACYLCIQISQML